MPRPTPLRNTHYGGTPGLPVLNWSLSSTAGSMSTLHAIWLEALATHCRSECPLHTSLFFDVPAYPLNPEPVVPLDTDPQAVRATYNTRLTAHLKKTDRLAEDLVRVHAIIHAQIGRSMTDALAMDPQYRARMDNSSALEYLEMIATLCRTGLVFEENAALNDANRKRALLVAFANIKQKYGQDLHAYHQEMEEIIATSIHVNMAPYAASMQVHQYLHGLDPDKYGDLIKNIDNKVVELPVTLSAMHRMAISWHSTKTGGASSGIVLNDSRIYQAFTAHDVTAGTYPRDEQPEELEYEQPSRSDTSWISPRAAPHSVNSTYSSARTPSIAHPCNDCGSPEHWSRMCPQRRSRDMRHEVQEAQRDRQRANGGGRGNTGRGSRARVNLVRVIDSVEFEEDTMPSLTEMSDSEDDDAVPAMLTELPMLGESVNMVTTSDGVTRDTDTLGGVQADGEPNSASNGERLSLFQVPDRASLGAALAAVTTVEGCLAKYG
jgi:hypothetical protein